MSQPSNVRRLLLAVALLLPILAILALIGRSERIVKSGTEWTLRISGYDPRDLIRGNYLQYRINWKMEAEDCQGRSCCYCLWNGDPGQPTPPEPSVRLVTCDDTAPCQSFFPSAKAAELSRFFIPEGEGKRLEAALRNREAKLLISVSPSGSVAVRELLVNGRPWRELPNPAP